MALVDVIIPYHNTPIAFTETAVRSVFDQTVRDWRIMLVNDHSDPEHTRDIQRLVESFGDPRIVYLEGESRGPSATRNAGIRRSDAALVAMLDSDDYWYPDRLEAGLDAMRRSKAGLVHGRVDILWPDGQIIKSQSVRALNELHAQTGSRLLKPLLLKNQIGCLTVLCQREYLESVGLFDEDLMAVEDKDLWLRLLLGGCAFHYMDRSVGVYRVHANNSSKKTDRLKTARLRLISKMDALVPSYDASLDWPLLRRQMQRHAYVEAAESALEAGDLAASLRYSLASPAGPSLASLTIAARTAKRAALRLVERAPQQPNAS